MSLRRPRPRFMSSPVLSDLTRFQAGSSASQLSNTSVWNSVQSAVLKVFQGGVLQANELYTLNESIRWLLKTELGSFITDYLQNQLLTKGLGRLLEKIQLFDGNNQLAILSEMWVLFFTETLPTLQAIFYPVQGQELTIRQMALLAFRDLVLMKLPLQDTLSTAVPAPLTQMLLVLQGVHEPSGPSSQYFQLEHLLEMVVSPYLSNKQQPGVLNPSDVTEPGLTEPDRTKPEDGCCVRSSHLRLEPGVRVSHARSDSSCLPPLVEQEGEAYLEKSGGLRRHTVANAPSDIQLLSASNRLHAGTCADSETSNVNGSGGGAGTFSNQSHIRYSLRGETRNGIGGGVAIKCGSTSELR